MSKPASTTGKRRADGTEVTNGGVESIDSVDNISISDEDVKKLEEEAKVQERTEMVIERHASKVLQEAYAKRRQTLKGIKNFWYHALRNHDVVAFSIQHKEDSEALTYLEDVWVERDPNEFRAYTLELHFAPNPFFSNTVLKKQYLFKAPPDPEANVPAADGLTQANIDFDFDRDVEIPPVQIDWKDPSKALTKLYPRVADPDEPTDSLETGSFFNMFEDEDRDMNLGGIIAETVFPDAINYFFGRVPQNTGDDFEEEDEEDEEDGSDEDEIDLEKPRKKVKAA